jgi:hypothetical protein
MSARACGSVRWMSVWAFLESRQASPQAQVCPTDARFLYGEIAPFHRSGWLPENQQVCERIFRLTSAKWAKRKQIMSAGVDAGEQKQIVYIISADFRWSVSSLLGQWIITCRLIYQYTVKLRVNLSIIELKFHLQLLHFSLSSQKWNLYYPQIKSYRHKNWSFQ